MRDLPVLYSASTYLAHQLAARYYGDVHYAWCSPIFDGKSAHASGLSVPPTSSPCEIYWGRYEAVKRRDLHSPLIIDNRVGVLRGAEEKFKAGVIDERTRDEIIAIVQSAETIDFRPLLFVIPYEGVKHLITEVPIGLRASPVSSECKVPELPGHLFDVLQLRSVI